MDFGDVESLLRSRIGLDPATVGKAHVAGAVRRRLAARGVPAAGEAEYLRMLRESADEFQALVEEVVTPETWFFRDVEPFRLLASRATEVTPAGPGAGPYKVLSAPCSTGEEPYSVAMALIESGLTPEEFQIDAVDLSARSIGLARAATYTSNAFRSPDNSFRDKYFQNVSGGFRLDPAVASLVRFRVANLLDPTLLAGGPLFQAVFCRNLLIYLDDEARERLVANLDRWLAPGGLLFVGHADRLGLLETRFRSVGVRGGFAYERRTGDASTVRVPAPSPRLPSPNRKGEVPPAPPRPSPHRVPATPSAPRPSVRAATISPKAPQVPPPSALDRAVALADLGRHAEARTLCEQHIRERGPCAASYFQLGIIRQALGDLAGAEEALQKAVYLDGGHEDALLVLSVLAQRRGDLAAAENYRRRAERAFREGTRS